MNELNTSHSVFKSLTGVLFFTSKILFPKYPHVVFPLFSRLYLAHRSRKMRYMKYRIKSVPSELFQLLLKNNIGAKFNGDVDSCILLSSSALHALGIKATGWLKMKVINRDISLDFENDKSEYNELTKITSCLVQAVSVAGMDESVAIINEILYHNLKEACMFCDDDNHVVFEKLESEKLNASFLPAIAINASISLIQTPIEIESKFLDSALKNYFSTPRYLCEGDIFSIDMRTFYPSTYFHSGYQSVDVVYFIVMNIIGPKIKVPYPDNLRLGFCIKFGSTTLSQGINQQRRLPKKYFQVISGLKTVSPKTYELALTSICPPGLDKYFSQLMKSVQPFLPRANSMEINKRFKLKPMFLLLGPQGTGKKEVVTSVCATLGLHLWNMDCLELQGNTPGFTEGKLKFIFKKVDQLSPCVLLLRNIEVLCKDKDGQEDSRVIIAFREEVSRLYDERNSSYPIFIIGFCNAKSKSQSPIAPNLARMFLHTIQFSSPNESEREVMLRGVVERAGLHFHDDVSLSQLASRTSGFLLEDIRALVSQAIRNHYKSLKLSGSEAKSSGESILSINKEDFENALDTMQSAFADAIGAPKIPAVTWDDIGGLADLKDEILRTITLPLQYPELSSTGLRRSGLLLYGPPGTGKTLLAKAVATECNLNFLSVKGPELLNMYVGQSEGNVREVFQRARGASPCIIFFDELDSLAPNRGRSGDSGGVMDRVVSQLLAELDGLQKATHLFVIGATNRPDLIDPALLRPGRFDKLLYVGACEDQDSKLSVITALTRKFHLKPGVDLKDVVSKLPSNLTGADMYALCSNAWLNAVRTCIHQLKQGANQETNEVVEVGASDFESAAATLTPSVSAEDMQYFQNIRKQMVGQKI